jgi:hypothetical protein
MDDLRFSRPGRTPGCSKVGEIRLSWEKMRSRDVRVISTHSFRLARKVIEMYN